MQEIQIRKAIEADIEQIDKLLYEVNNVHSYIRPDLFKKGAKKYTDDELKEIIANPKTPIFVAMSGEELVGYAFCIHQQCLNKINMTDVKTLYIDDLCVDEKARGQHVGKQLYEYVLYYAKTNGYYNITLNVWTGNESALRFYEKIGLKVQKIGMEKIL